MGAAAPPVRPRCPHLPSRFVRSRQPQPHDGGEFTAALQGKLRTSLDRFEQALAEGTTDGATIAKEHDESEPPLRRVRHRIPKDHRP